MKEIAHPALEIAQVALAVPHPKSPGHLLSSPGDEAMKGIAYRALEIAQVALAVAYS